MILCNVNEILSVRQFYRFFVLFSVLFIPLHTSIVGYSKAFAGNLTSPKISSSLSHLPKEVRKIRTDILRAAQSENVDNLHPIVERNEFPPITSFNSKLKPVEYWKSVSKKGDGREVLEEMKKVFALAYVIVKPGTPRERYVWPYLAELPVRKLTPEQEKDMLKLVSKEELENMKRKGKYLFYRASFGRDGTWHLFAKDE